MNVTSREFSVISLPLARIFVARSPVPATKDSLEMALSVNEVWLVTKHDCVT